MPSREPTLTEQTLRDDLAHTVFGSRPSGDDNYGLEIELIPVRWPEGADRPQHVPLREVDGALETRPVTKCGGKCEAVGTQGGTLGLVSTFAHARGLKVRTPEGHSTGACPAPLEGDFTFEPGGQVEFSSAPRNTPAAAFHEAADILDQLIAEAARQGIELHTIGFNPWLSADEIGLNTAAPRYHCMDAVYQSISPYGRRKMRQSATIHINIDFGGPERAPRRWRGSQLLAPVTLATFAFSPLADGKPTGFRSFRGRAWTDVDPSRCGFPPLFKADAGALPVDQYLDFALDARVLMLERHGIYEPQTEPLTFRQWLADGKFGTYPTMADWSNHLTTLFPDVRPRGFLELRSADSQSRAFWSVPLVWWTALICDDIALAQVLDLLGDTGGELDSRYLTAARDGLTDRTLGDQAIALYQIAEASLARFPGGYFSASMLRAFTLFGERFIQSRRTPADELLDKIAASGFDRATIAELHDTWCRLAGPSSQVETA